MQPKLKPSMVVESGAAGNRLIDRSTGKAAVVSKTDALILSLTDGQHTPAQIAAEAGRLGVPLMVADVHRAHERFQRAGILKPPGDDLAVVIDLPSPEMARTVPGLPRAAPAAMTAPPPPPPAEELSPADRLPPFRTDLNIRRTAKKNVLDTLDPRSGKSFQLYDFEVSLARMMDGRRTAAQVLETASGLGIPVSLEQLAKFIRQLEAYGFLAAWPEPDTEESAPAPEPTWGKTWERREAWEDAVRALFRSGLRMLRLSKPSEAREYFAAVLEAAPDNQEAREMLAVAEAALASGAPAVDAFGPDERTVVVQPAPAPPQAEPPAEAPAQHDSGMEEKLRALQSLSSGSESSSLPTHREARRSGRGRALPWTIAVVAVLGAGGWTVWTQLKGPAPGATPKLHLVSAHFEAPAQHALLAAGYVSAAHLFSVGAPAGRVKTVAVKEGQKVQPGAILVALDDSEQQAQMKLARARMRDASRNLNSTKKLYRAQAATAVELDRATGQSEIAWAELSVIQERVKQAIVRSPITGTVLEVPVHPGELVAGNDTAHPVVKLADLADLVAEVAVNEADVHQVHQGQAAEVASDALPGQQFVGEVTEISEQADRARGTVNVKVAVRQPGDVLRPGMSVKATFKNDAAAPPRLLLPAGALDGDAVWLLDAGGKAVRKPVRSRSAGAGMVEILEGVSEGDRVVTEGAGGLVSGQKAP